MVAAAMNEPSKIGVDGQNDLVSLKRVERTLLVLRRRRVILDSDLAALCDVTVSVFNRAVKRNIERFPADFAFQLTRERHETLRSQKPSAEADASEARRVRQASQVLALVGQIHRTQLGMRH
jgi:ORF6N domain